MPTDPQAPAERTAFEAWAEAAQFCIHRDDTDKYRDYHRVSTRFAWEAWQARGALQPATQAHQPAMLTEDDVGMTRISDGCFVCGGNPRPRIVPKGKFLCCEKCGGGYGEVP